MKNQVTNDGQTEHLTQELFEGKIAGLKAQLNVLSEKIEARAKSHTATEEQIARSREKYSKAIENGEREIAAGCLDEIKSGCSRLSELRTEGHSMGAMIQDLQDEVVSLKPFCAKFLVDADRMQEAARAARQLSDSAHGKKVNLLTVLSGLEQKLSAQSLPPEPAHIPAVDPAEQARLKHDELLAARKSGFVPPEMRQPEYDETAAGELEKNYVKR